MKTKKRPAKQAEGRSQEAKAKPAKKPAAKKTVAREARSGGVRRRVEVAQVRRASTASCSRRRAGRCRTSPRPSPASRSSAAGGRTRKGKAIFDALSELDDCDDVRCFKLIDGKVTFVHRRLWPALVRLARDGVLAADRVASIQQEHMPTGEHRNIVTPFPDWVRRRHEPRRRCAERRRGTRSARRLGVKLAALAAVACHTTAPVPIANVTPPAVPTCSTNCLPTVDYTDATGRHIDHRTLAGRVVVIAFVAGWARPAIEQMTVLANVCAAYQAHVSCLQIATDNSVAPSSSTVPTIPTTAEIVTAYDHPDLVPTLLVYARDGSRAYDHAGLVNTARLRAILDPLVR